MAGQTVNYVHGFFHRTLLHDQIELRMSLRERKNVFECDVAPENDEKDYDIECVSETNTKINRHNAV